ncbi:hypothetical protein OL548_04410 [Lysinibacillus sp. MHQ-1]|nr:hypothetical protein OL548_04410 [Lysinibacillus sp. MHQ-1]
MAEFFLLSSIIMSIICKIGPNKMAEGFITGARDMVEGALIIGFAQTILVITTNGGLIDTILHFVSNAVSVLPASINAVGMFFTSALLEFLSAFWKWTSGLNNANHDTFSRLNWCN